MHRHAVEGHERRAQLFSKITETFRRCFDAQLEGVVDGRTEPQLARAVRFPILESTGAGADLVSRVAGPISSMEVQEGRLDTLQRPRPDIEETDTAGTSQVLACRTRQRVAADAADIERHLAGGLTGIEHIEHVVLLAQGAHGLGGIDQTSVGRCMRQGHHGRAPGQFSLQMLKIDLAVLVVLDEHHFDAVAFLQLQQGDDVADVLCSTGENSVASGERIAVDRHVPCAGCVLDHGYLLGLRVDQPTERCIDRCDAVGRFGSGLITTDGGLAFKVPDNRGEHHLGRKCSARVVEVQDMVDPGRVLADLVERQPRIHRLRLQSHPQATRGVCVLSPERGFPVEEFSERTRRCQALMAEHRIAAILVCTEPEVRYFSGFHTPFWQSPTRPWFTVIGAAGKPIAVIPSIGEATMSQTWIDDVRTWSSPRPHDDGVTLLADCIREVAPTGPVGLPMGPETHVRMPLRDLDRLRSMLGDFVDATDVIRGLRMVKSEREVEKHRYICGVVSEAFDELPELLSTGMTEREAFTAFRAEILRLGADDVPYLVGATGPGGIDDIIRQPSDRRIDDGDMLIFDTGSTFDGYFSDFDRNFAFTSADSRACDAYKAVWEATEAGLEVVRPGATTSDVFTAMSRVLKHYGSLGSGVGRTGHGLGTQVTEWPSITADDDTVIEQNMVLTIEPSLIWEPGKVMVHEENLVVRSDGPELLSRRAVPELPVI